MVFQRIVSWYKRYERPISSLSLVGGFVFDALTLKRVDTFLENFWVIVHLLVVMAVISLINTKDAEKEESTELHFWLINLLQFTFGGLLSTFLVFYFRSANLSTSWPFLLLLVAAFAANERLKKHYERLAFQVGLLFLSLFSFMIFSVPVVLHRLGPIIFLASGGASLLLIWIFLRFLKRLMKARFEESRRLIVAAISTIFIVINILYFTNLIPPIPLSLKEAGLYHQVARGNNGSYLLTKEPGTWRNFFTTYDDVHITPGESLSAYTAIFSPGAFSTTVIHEWQSYDERQRRWVITTRVSLPVVGGRDNGFRTYSVSKPPVGRGRVRVLTPEGQVIGVIDFKVTVVPVEPPLMTETS